MAGIENMTLGLVLFFVIHLFAGTYILRNALTDIIGSTGYRLLHSAITLAGLYYIIIGFQDRPVDALVYEVPSWGYRAPIFAMPFALMLVAGSRFRDIKRITRHPFLWGIWIWALSHLLANNDFGAVLLFGSFLAYSSFAFFTSDRKMRLKRPEEWEDIARTTSIIPFAAMIAGRSKPAKGGSGRFIVGLGLLMYILLAYLHPLLTGVAVVGFYH